MGLVPLVKLGLVLGFHAVGMVVICLWHGTHLLLEGGCIFFQPEGPGKRRLGHGKNVQAVNGLDAPGNGHTEEFGPVDDLSGGHGFLVQLLEEKDVNNFGWM